MSSHIQTPVRKISLRRKRQNDDYKEATAIKRISPSQEMGSEELQKSRLKTSVKGHRNCTNLMTPKSTHRKNRNGARKTESTSPLYVNSGNRKQKKDSSPSTPISPFTSSQIPSTQDCEVVWDCNSPGYSKDDLKEIHISSISKSCVTPSASNLCSGNRSKRLLELPTRIEMQNTCSVSEELDNLLTIVNEDDEFEEISSKKDPLWEYNQGKSDFLKEASQPFKNFPFIMSNRSTEEENEKEIAASETTFRLQVQDREEGITDNEVKNSCNSSFSSVDEDFFSESFLESTQALEDAFFNQNGKPKTSERVNIDKKKCELHSPLSRVRKKVEDCLESSSASNKNKLSCKNENNSSKLLNTQPLTTSYCKSSTHICKDSFEDIINSTNVLKNVHKPRPTLHTSQEKRVKSLKNGTLSSTTTQHKDREIIRSKSEIVEREKGPFRKCNSLEHSMSLDFDSSDDEIFASLIPTLVEVEAEYSSQNLSECVYSNGDATTVKNLMHLPLVRDSEFNSLKSIIANPSVGKKDNAQYNSTLKQTYQKHIQPKKELYFCKGNGIGERKESIMHTCEEMNKCPCIHHVTHHSGNKNEDTLGQEANDDDDDDDVFLQEEVLDYISRIECNRSLELVNWNAVKLLEERIREKLKMVKKLVFRSPTKKKRWSLISHMRGHLIPTPLRNGRRPDHSSSRVK